MRASVDWSNDCDRMANGATGDSDLGVAEGEVSGSSLVITPASNHIFLNFSEWLLLIMTKDWSRLVAKIATRKQKMRNTYVFNPQQWKLHMKYTMDNHRNILGLGLEMVLIRTLMHEQSSTPFFLHATPILEWRPFWELNLWEDTIRVRVSPFFLLLLNWARELFLGISSFISDPWNLCILLDHL